MLAYRGLPTAVRAEPRADDKPKFGPPPPGYIRILGESVPGWTSADLLTRGPGPLDWQPIGPRPIEDEFWSGNDQASGRVVSIAVVFGIYVYLTSRAIHSDQGDMRSGLFFALAEWAAKQTIGLPSNNERSRTPNSSGVTSVLVAIRQCARRSTPS